jgi:tRNA(fMet)-specific endonuclease VapC
VMVRFMLDSDVCIHAMRRNAPGVLRRLSATRSGEVAISSIVAAELWVGIMKSRDKDHSEHAVSEFLALVEVVGWPREAALVYGKIRAALERQGLIIGAMDLLIAAHALHERATLVTRNVAGFARVEGLKIESWTAA